MRPQPPVTATKREVRLRDAKQRTLVVIVDAKSAGDARKVVAAQFPALRLGSMQRIKTGCAASGS